MPLLRRLLGMMPAVEDESELQEMAADEPEIRSILVLSRSPDSFYHNLPDEEFCTWARGWSSVSQVLTSEDREEIVERLREQNEEWVPDSEV